MNNRNLITTLAIVALITIAATSAGCATNTSPTATPTPIPATETVIGNNTTFSSAVGFNITYPKNLRIDSNQTENASQPVRVYIYVDTNNTNNKVDGVVVGTSDITANDTLADWYAFNLNKINNYPNFKQLTVNNSTTLGGKRAYTIVWQGTVPVQQGADAAGVTNTTLKVMQSYVVNHNKGYVVTYKALPSDYDKYLAQAQRIMNSFALPQPFNQV